MKTYELYYMRETDFWYRDKDLILTSLSLEEISEHLKKDKDTKWVKDDEELLWTDGKGNRVFVEESEIVGFSNLHTNYPIEEQELIKLAVSIILKDPIAMDMAREVLKI